MEDSIQKFTEQFDFVPEVQNSEKIKNTYTHYILGGMGGSHLAAGLFHVFRPGIDLYIHRNYGLPSYDDDFMHNSLFIASSYSGNTEETVDFLEAAYSKGYDVAAITTGGKLLDFAKENQLPYVLIPDTGIQPRAALGFAALALASLVDPNLLPEIAAVKENLDIDMISTEGSELAHILKDKTPVIYSSADNRALSYIWKIKMNETAKVPAYHNVFPELNHNEMQGFDYNDKNRDLSIQHHFIFMHDSKDDPRIELRMKKLEEIYQEKGLGVTSLFLEGDTEIEKMFRSILLADWTTLNLAKYYGTEPEAVPLIEDFKRRLK